MRRLRGHAVISLALVGCGFSTTAPTTDGGPRDIAEGAEMLIDGPPDDVDADGVPNATDNCPMKANAGQYDEDADTRGDECDPCPHLGGTADVDTDGDNVGNGCDPRPTTPGDKLAYWNGFHVASVLLPSTLTMLHGSADRWSVANGELVFAPNSGDWGMPVVDVGAVLHTVDTNVAITTDYVGASAAGAMVDIAENDSDGFECQARIDRGTFGTREMWRRDPEALNGDGWTELQVTSSNTPVDDTYRIVLQRTATDTPCATTRAGQVTISLVDGTDSLNNTRAGLFARNVDARFKYIAVYTAP